MKQFETVKPSVKQYLRRRRVFLFIISILVTASCFAQNKGANSNTSFDTDAPFNPIVLMVTGLISFLAITIFLNKAWSKDYKYGWLAYLLAFCAIAFGIGVTGFYTGGGGFTSIIIGFLVLGGNIGLDLYRRKNS